MKLNSQGQGDPSYYILGYYVFFAIEKNNYVKLN